VSGIRAVRPDEPAPAADGRGGTSAPRAPCNPEASTLRLSPQARLVTFWACVALAGLFLWAVRGILQPFVIALVLVYLLNPLVAQITRRARLPRWVAVSGVYLVLVLLLAWGALVVLPGAAAEARELATMLPRVLVRLRAELGPDRLLPIPGAEVSLPPVADEITRSVAGLVGAASRSLVGLALHTVETLLKGLLALSAAFYLLLGADRLERGVRNLIPPRYRAELGPVVRDIDRVLGRFVRGEVVLIAVMSAATWLALSLLGIRYALLLGLLAGVLELIPLIGPVVAAVPAVGLALLQPSPFGWSPLVNAAVVALVYFVLRHAEDYFVIPTVIGRAVELHPVLAMFAALSGAALGGVLGIFLGIPTAAALRVVARYVYRKLVEGPAPAPEVEAVPEVEPEPAPEPAAVAEPEPAIWARRNEPRRSA
jgi:predicted PurR-regulated permease PerM